MDWDYVPDLDNCRVLNTFPDSAVSKRLRILLFLDLNLCASKTCGNERADRAKVCSLSCISSELLLETACFVEDDLAKAVINRFCSRHDSRKLCRKKRRSISSTRPDPGRSSLSWISTLIERCGSTTVDSHLNPEESIARGYIRFGRKYYQRKNCQE